MMWLFSVSTWALLGFLCFFIGLINIDRKNNKKCIYTFKTAPGPRQWPIIGSIIYMSKFTDGSVAFSSLAKEYGNVVTLKLGSVDTVVISGLENFRQVLITDSHLFDARPNFPRYNLLFGQKDNSIEFCDWNPVLKKRREIISRHTFPRSTTSFFHTLDDIATENIRKFIDVLKLDVSTATSDSIAIKPKLSKLLCAIFLKYFCSIDVDREDPDFCRLVDNTDMIVQEINEGCLGDCLFLPWLMPLMKTHHLVEASREMRRFIATHCIEPRLALRKAKEAQKSENNNADVEDIDVVKENFANDMLDCFLNNINCPEGLTLDKAMYALEDIIGGHAPITNLFIRILYFVANAPYVQEKIRHEFQNQSGDLTKIGNKLPYIEATLWEAMRHVSSPFVPHQTTHDAVVDGYMVKKGTVIFLNNYDLHFSSNYWKDPEVFDPERFLVDGKVVKPDYFIPFSFGNGKRSCLGYKMVMNLCVTLLANFCLNFKIELDPTEDYHMSTGNISVPGAGKRFVYKPIPC